ncbi:RecQ family ATP-dependent DNA helicase [Ferrovum myxofaciens]|uniref:ATP-dependent DNA helicase RecQ n=3 Tax=root TaxID=1 RepID=A0A9E6MW81_9PROT|nr:RecQ family ATP-dependent DNA helicase [Ferrovum myxofaciens]QWY74560.1 MAG: RecQ family ATP-dependent DNA helicase [Ferrovum myxofaciens]QWY77309.1 MAG: RecQ family ATP-dependent DNA helicase [Ferrovum myxofaciens]
MDPALKILRETFGYTEFRGFQKEVIDHVGGGGHALVLMPTGGGKSLCYQIPGLLRPGVTLVISPLIALMQDQVQALRKRGVAAACLNSFQAEVEMREVQKGLMAHELKFLYLAPERLVQRHFQSLLKGLYEGRQVALFAIDECHCIAEWGHDFRPEYRQLSVLAEQYPEVPRIAVTATADVHTRQEIGESLTLDGARCFVSSFDRPNLHYCAMERKALMPQVENFLQRHCGQSGIVYCPTRRMVESLAMRLQIAGWPCLHYHAGLSSALREQAQNQFLQPSGQIMIATIAFGMGIDKPDIRFVIHLAAPRSLEGYYQETGRAGRDGQVSEVLLLHHPEDGLLFCAEEAGTGNSSRQLVWQRKREGVERFIRTQRCRRQVLLDYFGESHEGHCGTCDVCNSTYLGWSGSFKRLSTVLFAPVLQTGLGRKSNQKNGM